MCQNGSLSGGNKRLECKPSHNPKKKKVGGSSGGGTEDECLKLGVGPHSSVLEKERLGGGKQEEKRGRADFQSLFYMGSKGQTSTFRDALGQRDKGTHPGKGIFRMAQPRGGVSEIEKN